MYSNIVRLASHSSHTNHIIPLLSTKAEGYDSPTVLFSFRGGNGGACGLARTSSSRCRIRSSAALAALPGSTGRPTGNAFDGFRGGRAGGTPGVRAGLVLASGIDDGGAVENGAVGVPSSVLRSSVGFAGGVVDAAEDIDDVDVGVVPDPEPGNIIPFTDPA
jgi:hypothetical protein